MNPQTLITTYACLLSGVRKISGACGPAAPHIEYSENVDCIVQAAEAVSAIPAGGQTDRLRPLMPVFTHMNGTHTDKVLPFEKQSELQMPQNAFRVAEQQYRDLFRGLSADISRLTVCSERIPSLLSVLETWMCNVPSAAPDISLFDHSKVTAAVGACISEYLLDHDISDYKNFLFANRERFSGETAFLLYSADFSGIQKFIYTVSVKNALRALRSRSFFLELTLEHYIDELLNGCGVSRANLLYSGGGHCYILLPNTESVQRTVAGFNNRFNDWLLGNFGASLYLADGWTECCANDLTNTPGTAEPYKAMFRRVSSAIASRKLRRYSAEQVKRLNSADEDMSGHECRICGRTRHLVKDPDGDTFVCPMCAQFEQLSGKLLNKNVFLVSYSLPVTPDFQLPSQNGMVGFYLMDKETARPYLKSANAVIRVYTKNMFDTDLCAGTGIYMGDYAASSSMEELAVSSNGIQRLGICRMDVDNLGQAFVSGFEQTNAQTPVERQRYVTLARTSAFSRQMSLFFKYSINAILSGKFQNREPLQVTVVYSGGDDVFLVGAWKDVICAASRIRSAFREYTCGALSISGGIGLFDDHYPIRLAANETAGLEDASKDDLPDKDGITLFAAGQGHTYKWDVFESEVWGQKLTMLLQFFGSGGQEERGNAFLYRLMKLLRNAQYESAANQRNSMQLARYAYLLARLEPREGAPNHKLYNQFSKAMYAWALNSRDRQQLLTAICLYVYLTRKER